MNLRAQSWCWTLIASLAGGAISAYISFLELEPIPRKVVRFDCPVKTERFTQAIFGSKDGKTVAFHYEEWTWHDPVFEKASLHVIDLESGDVFVQENARRFALLADGKRIVGALVAEKNTREEIIVVWDRRTGKELERFRAGQELAELQNALKNPMQLLVNPTTEETWWTPLRMLTECINWIYAGGDDPAPIAGVRCSDPKTGAELAKLHGRGIFGILPDDTSFVWLQGSDESTTVTLAVYDWPIQRPWLLLVVYALAGRVLFAMIVRLICWNRNR